MREKKIRAILLALLLAGIAMVPCVNAEVEEENSDDTDSVSIEKAQAIAALNIKDIAVSASEFSDWETASVELSKIYYDLDDRVTAYAFEVSVDGNYAGYILISATRKKFPVLEASKGRIPGENPEILRPEDPLEGYSSEHDFGVVGSKPVYLGGLGYYEKYTLSDSAETELQEVYIDEHTNTIVDLAPKSQQSRTHLSDNQRDILQQDFEAEITRKWEIQDILLSETDVTEKTELLREIQSTRSARSISGVPFYRQNWTRGCSPTAAAMVVAYWDRHGYSNLSVGRPLVISLAESMGTSSTWPINGGTWPWNIEPGINDVFYRYTQIRPASSEYLPDWDKCKDEIDEGRPFVLNMLSGGIAVDGTQVYGHHSVACVGYVSGTNDYLTLHDTWDVTRNQLIRYGNWAGSMNTWVRP